ncbi:zeta-sarcoglycan-like [Dendronephthya gigantea]|uniref:zeta-sarcoglycan-like n=1 Tax=Dendronephthya gigantea TaxID=151771 RepID=UPI00106D8905|nr:zeta-sarcoglycan-like [Dendronephthya gigantea]XP_028397883.1 zeta-sarcoglycan-like [Dendronephthya gigantea]XP_028397884.1 zeta-sarcoglycan-like [Dendronephthya gigantea]
MSRRQDTNQSNDDIDYTRHDPVNIIYKIGIYGWRKRCLYLLILIITVITIINLALTIWIMHVMNFNLDGMGKLKITNKGVLLQGNAEFVKPLYAESIETRKDKPIVVQSTANVTINARNESGATVSQFFVGNDEIVAKQKVFKVQSNSGKELLYADKNVVRFGYNQLRFASAESTVNFTGALQTEKVRSPPSKHLELHSPTRSVRLEAPEMIEITTKAGDISVKSKYSASFTSNEFIFDGKKIVFKDLPVMKAGGKINNSDAKEVCLCPNGRMFAAWSGTNCSTAVDICK